MNTFKSNVEILSKYFPYDIICIILEYKKKEELKEIVDYHIEKDFFNMLTYDQIIRGNYELSPIFINYYDKYYEKLGLVKYNNTEDSLRRTKSLSQMYASKWWKYTEKSSPKWLLVHSMINENSFVKICRDDSMENWEIPSLKEKLSVLRRINYETILNFFCWWLKRNESIYITKTHILI
jgi:hypothetical protein